MNRRKNLVTLGGVDAGVGDEAVADTVLHSDDHAPTFDQAWDEDEQPAPRRKWLGGTLALLAVVGWTGFFGWSHLAQFRAGITPADGASLVSSWAVPVLLVAALWPAARRSFTHDATLLSQAARQLEDESERLSQRLVAMNGELSLARDFIAAQGRDLEALGRLAAERLSGNADRLQGLIRDNGAQLQAIGEVSESALGNMDKLRERLPVVANAARDVTSQIGHAGNTAQAQVDDLITAFARLNEFGEASTRQVASLKTDVDETLAGYATRLESLRVEQEAAHGKFGESVDQMQDRLARALGVIGEVDEAAMANSRRRVEALAEAETKVRQTLDESAAAFETERQRRHALLDEAHEAALAALAARMAEFDRQNAARQEEITAQLAAITARGEELTAQLAHFDGEIARLTAAGVAASGQLEQAGGAFSANLAQSGQLLTDSSQQMSRLTDDSVRLLELIRASAEHSQGALSEAIGKADQRLSTFENRATTLSATVEQAAMESGSLVLRLTTAGEQGESLQTILAALDNQLAALTRQTGELTTQASNGLEQSLAALEQATTDHLARLNSGHEEGVRALVQRLGTEADGVLGAAFEHASVEALAKLEEATRNAAEQGRATALTLRDQLAKVNELAGNLETRVAAARTRAEEQVNSDFTRRMALITESLNSCSIDIARALDSEVTDTAWAGYLKGDRGIFTRRAVRLLDGQEVRAISEAYDADETLRMAVNRYIHDFEALLRPVLSTRDGNALAVTLLSSDIGKLYVVLAQAIERLRD